MLRLLKIANSNFLKLFAFGIRGSHLGFRVWIEKVFTILFHHLIIGLRGATGQNDI